jgi:hypothetical protein
MRAQASDEGMAEAAQRKAFAGVERKRSHPEAVKPGFGRTSPERCRCPFRVNRVVLTVGQLLPVYPDKQTSSEPVGVPQTCQKELIKKQGDSFR